MQPGLLRTTTAPNLDHYSIDNNFPELNCAVLKLIIHLDIPGQTYLPRHDSAAHVAKECCSACNFNNKDMRTCHIRLLAQIAVMDVLILRLGN